MNKFFDFLAKLWMPSVLILLIGIFILNTEIYLSPINTDRAKNISVEVFPEFGEVVSFINEIRLENGLKELKLNGKLTEAAFNKAMDMVKNDYFSHISPKSKKSWKDFILESNYKYKSIGENLARGFTSNQYMVEKWMDSPAHKRNILDPEFEEIGIGYHKDSNGIVYFVMTFGDPV
jgi:uncharacterized protein YkwD